jgi:hypothetical protein
MLLAARARCYGPLLNESSLWCFVFGKFKSARRDPVTVGAVVAIVFAGLVIGGIAYFYNNRPSDLVETAQRLLNVPQVFRDTFR